MVALIVKVKVVFGKGVPRFLDGILVIHTDEKPENGRANRDIVNQVAKLYGIPAADVSIRGGLKSRRKVLELKGADSIQPP